MPLYEYACADCGAECEVLQKIHEPNPQICPNCEATLTIVSNFGTSYPLESRQELRKRCPSLSHRPIEQQLLIVMDQPGHSWFFTTLEAIRKRM